jgi:membrane associated rhomboid family serine protease
MPDFRRSPPPAWSQPLLDRLTPSVRNLIIAITLGYFFFVLAPVADEWMVTHLFLGPRLFRGEAWQPVTALFLHVRFTNWIFSVIGLWWVGAFVERVKGQRFFLGMFFGAGIAANVVAALASLALSGAAGARSDGAAYALTALFVAFARIYGARPVQILGAFSWRADYFTGILIGFSLLLALVNRDLAGFLAEATAIGVALAATGPLKLSSLFPTNRSGRAKARYRVLDGGKRPPNRPN